MGAHVRFGGHFVQVCIIASRRRHSDSQPLFVWPQAHVDTTATLISRTPDGDSVRLLFQLPEPTPERPSLLRYIIPKGYVAIDGASLTVTVVDDAKRTFGVMLITHTQEKITLGKKPSLSNRRLAFNRLRDRDMVVKLFDELGPRYATRNGGYLRILKCGFRDGDNAPMAYVELLDRPDVEAVEVEEAEAA